MAFPAPEFKEPIATPPKLSLFSLPTKPTTLPDGLTPPLNTVAAIPFHWEEAPGKPRATSTTTTDNPPKSKAVRSLDLPPRLTTTMGSSTSSVTNSDRIEVIPSPTTVLSGPYEVVYSSKSVLGSPEKVVGNSNSGKSKGKIKTPLRNLMRRERTPSVKFSSWRWNSFRDIGGEREDRSPSAKFCSWRWDSFSDMRGGNSAGGGGFTSSLDELQKSLDSNSQIGKVRRRNSFAVVNRSASGFLVNMYGTLKQAMQWRSRR